MEECQIANLCSVYRRNKEFKTVFNLQTLVIICIYKIIYNVWY